MDNIQLISSGQYFKEDGTELATPGRFNSIFDEINTNATKQFTPNPSCDAQSDLVTYIEDTLSPTTYPSSVVIRDVTTWPIRMLNNVNIQFSLADGPGRLEVPAGNNGPGAYVEWDIGTYTGDLGSHGVRAVTVQMTATWDDKTKVSYTTFNLVSPPEKGDPALTQIHTMCHVNDTDIPLNSPVSGEAEFTFQDISLYPFGDTIERAWQLYRADDFSTELLSTAPNSYVGTLTGTPGDPNFSGGVNGTPTLRVPVKIPGAYRLRQAVKGNFDESSGDPFTTTMLVESLTGVNVHPYAAFTLTNVGGQPISPTRLYINQSKGSSTIEHPDYTNAKSLFQSSDQYHYIEVRWGRDSDQAGNNSDARLFSMSVLDLGDLNIIPEDNTDYFLVNLNDGGSGSDWWNGNYFWILGLNISGYSIIDTLTYSEVPAGGGKVGSYYQSSIRSDSFFSNLVIKVPAGTLPATTINNIHSISTWQIGPGAEKYKVELKVISSEGGTSTIIEPWKQVSFLGLDGLRPAPIRYRFLNIPEGLELFASVTSINGSVASTPNTTESLIVGYSTDWLPEAPTNLSFTPHTFGVQLSFDPVAGDPVAGVDYYEIAYGDNANIQFDSSNMVICTRSTMVNLNAEAGSNVYVKVRAVCSSGLAGPSTSGMHSVAAGYMDTPAVQMNTGSRVIDSSKTSREERTISYHANKNPGTIISMGVYVYSMTNNTGLDDFVTIYNGDKTSYYSIPISGVGYYTDDNFPEMSIGTNENVCIANWHTSWDNTVPQQFNDIEVSVDYTIKPLPPPTVIKQSR